MTPAPRGPAKYWLTGRRAQRSTPRLEQNTYFRERRQSNVSGRRTAWLGREDSNLRMVESKSGNPLNNFNEHSEKSVEFSLEGLNRLSGDSE